MSSARDAIIVAAELSQWRRMILCNGPFFLVILALSGLINWLGDHAKVFIIAYLA